MTDALDVSTDPAPLDERMGIGGNSPPIAELLAEETKLFRERATALITNVKASHIDSPETAAAVTTLGNMLRDLKEKVETARKDRAKPFDDGKAAVQRAFKADIIDPIDAAMATARTMLDAWRRALDEQAAAERRRRDAEAAEAQRVADAAAAAKEVAQQGGDTGAAIRAEMEELQARERAAELSGDSGTIRPEAIIHSHAGSALSARTRVPVVTNIGECLRWMLENQAGALVEAITPLIARLVRAKVVIPGVEVREERSTRFRR